MPDDPSRNAFRTSVALRRGATPGQLRGPRWAHVAHGLVAPADRDVPPLMQRLSIATGLMTDACVLGGWAALVAQGYTWFDGVDHRGERPALVHCLPGSQLRPHDGIQIFRGLVHPDEVTRLETYDVTTPARAAFDEMRLAHSWRDAVVALDMATSTTHGGPHTSPQEVNRVIASHFKVRGMAKARRAMPFGSTRAASPWETRTRLLASLDADVKGLKVNVPIFGPSGQILGIADLLQEESGLVIESDGAGHRDELNHALDNRREEAFERAGLTVARVTAIDHSDAAATIYRLRAAERDARLIQRRNWTTTPPKWWYSWPAARQWL